MKNVNPYLSFPGNTEEAFTFYQSVFGGDIQRLQRYTDMPGGEEIPEADRDKIMHMELHLGNGNVLMASDALESMGRTLTPGNNFSLTLSPDSKEEAKSIFDQLADGGTVRMPLEDTFWGAYFGMCTDKFGVRWLVNYEY